MTILAVAVVALALFVVLAALISGFLWISERKALTKRDNRDQV